MDQLQLSVTRCLRPVVAALMVAVCVGSLLWWLGTVVVTLGSSLTGGLQPSLEELLTLVAATGALLLLLRLLLSLLVAVLLHVPGVVGRCAGAVALRCTTAATRRAAAMLVGASLSGALAPGTAVAAPGAHAGPRSSAVSRVVGGTLPEPGFAVSGGAGATPTPTATARATARATAPATATATRPPTAADPVQPTRALPTSAESTEPPGPGWTPPRPSVRPQPETRLLGAARPSPAQAPGTVVVHRGDTLWDIARRHLGARAGDGEVAAAWPLWHEANRAVIGDDPNLIRPGQVLRAPTVPAHR